MNLFSFKLLTVMGSYIDIHYLSIFCMVSRISDLSLSEKYIIISYVIVTLLVCCVLSSLININGKDLPICINDRISMLIVII